MNFLACPYCSQGIKYEPGKKRSNTFGRYKVKIKADNTLIFHCVKCRKMFKGRQMGAFLDMEDRLLII